MAKRISEVPPFLTSWLPEVVVVEWGEGLAERLSDNHLDISLQRCVDTDVRIAHWQWNRV